MKLPSSAIAAVIGYPVKQSKSPLIHNWWLRTDNKPGEYITLEIAPESLSEAMMAMRNSSLHGFNVTIPHKQAIMHLCDEVDDKARLIGAVNTVSIQAGKLRGTNTDAFGFIRNIQEAEPGFDFTNGSAVVIGAGGAARAVIYGLLQEGVPEIFVTNRTQERAELLVSAFGPKVQVIPWNNRASALAATHVVINTTSLGMISQPPLDLPIYALSTDAIVCDIVYNPLETELLLRAAEKGCRTVGGLGMLVWQAAKSYEVWFGNLPHVDHELIRKLTASL